MLPGNTTCHWIMLYVVLNQVGLDLGQPAFPQTTPVRSLEYIWTIALFSINFEYDPFQKCAGSRELNELNGLFCRTKS